MYLQPAFVSWASPPSVHRPCLAVTDSRTAFSKSFFAVFARLNSFTLWQQSHNVVQNTVSLSRRFTLRKPRDWSETHPPPLAKRKSEELFCSSADSTPVQQDIPLLCRLNYCHLLDDPFLLPCTHSSSKHSKAGQDEEKGLVVRRKEASLEPRLR